MRSDVSDYDLIVVRHTPAAVLLKEDEDPEAPAIWLPKSQIETEHDDTGPCVVTIPDWLATEKGLT